MSDTTLTQGDLITQHVDWLRALARSLVHDTALAEDLAQEVQLRALRRPPAAHTAQSVRSWLGTVLRNLASETFRGNARRTARERIAARPEAEPPQHADDDSTLVAQVRTQRHLADALLALDEPYRSTVLMRFYEGLPPREIAKRQGAPIATVKSRLHRGLAKLREHLDRAHGGDRRAWLLPLVPLAGPLPAAPATPPDPQPLGAEAAAGSGLALGGLTMQTKFVAAAGLTLLALAGGFWLSDTSVPDGTPGAGTSAGATSSAFARPGRNPEAPEPSDAARRTAVAAPPGAAAARDPRPIGLAAGRIVDAEGRGLPGLAVRDAASPAGENLAISERDGSFAFETARASHRLEVTTESGGGGWVTVRAGAWRRDATLEPLVIAARALALEGRVVDDRGDPVPDASLRLGLPRDFRTRFRDVVDATYQPAWAARTNGDGTFALRPIPAVRGAHLDVVCDGYHTTVLDVPTRSVENLEIRLSRSDAEGHADALRGRVLLPSGAPAGDARVVAGFAMARTDDQGFFALEQARTADAEMLRAIAPGFAPVEAEVPEPGSLAVIRLAHPARSLHARIVAADGEPLEGARVLLADPTPFGTLGMLPLSSEGLSAGAPIPELALESSLWQVNRYERATGSARPALAPNAMLGWSTTDGTGRVELDGLADRPYRLLVVAEDLSFTHASEPLLPGDAVHEVRVPTPATWPEVRGRVVTRLGDPVGGVRIVPYLPVFRQHVPVPGGATAHITRWFQVPAIESAADGTFALRDVPKSALQFYLVADEILPAYAGVELIDDPLDVVVRVEARSHLDVELVDPTFADGMRVRDVDGELVQILRMRADGHSDDTTLEFAAGKSGVVTITSSAATLELIRDGQVVDRIDLTPRPGVVQRVQR